MHMLGYRSVETLPYMQALAHPRTCHARAEGGGRCKRYAMNLFLVALEAPALRNMARL